MMERRKIRKFKNEVSAKWYCGTLNNIDMWKEATRQVRNIGLKSHIDPPKNWDSLAAIDYIVNNTSKNAQILDAGAEYYSTVLPWLEKLGYKNLVGINIAFGYEKPFIEKHKKYQFGNVMKTEFLQGEFDIITCMSVIEHNIDLEMFFRECSFILKKGGSLIVSFDYKTQFDENVKQRELMGMKWEIFSMDDIKNIIRIAKKYDLELVEDFFDTTDYNTILSEDLEIAYTFAILTFKSVKK